MKKFLSTFIGTLLTLSLFTAQAPDANAIYSPVVSAEVALIKMHLKTSKERNGYMSLEEVWKNLAEKNKARKEQKKAFGIPGDYIKYVNEQKRLLMKSLTFSFFNDIALLLGSFSGLGWYESCLRDDIWTLQALQEEVMKELYKAALLSDSQNAAILWNDYQLLYALINGGVFTKIEDGKAVVNYKYEEKGLMWHYDDTKLWFDSEAAHNYYVDCPYGEFKKAIDEVIASLRYLRDTFASGGEGGLFAGGLKEMVKAAEKRAKIRAAQWIAANQIKVSFGGEQGGNPRSLIQGPGGKKLIAELRVYDQMITDFGKSFKPRFDVDTTTVREFYKEYEKVEKQKELMAYQMKTALTFNLSLSSVADQSLKTIDGTLFKINQQIQRAYKNELTDANLHNFCEQFLMVVKTQCKNHSAEVPLCK